MKQLLIIVWVGLFFTACGGTEAPSKDSSLTSSDGGNDSSDSVSECEDLNAVECESATQCDYKTGTNCGQSVGFCTALDTLCGNLATAAVSPGGDCYVFPNTCIPDDFEPYESGVPKCEATCQ